MSIPQFLPKSSYTGTGSLATYTFDFKITYKTQLSVVVLDIDGNEIQRLRGTDTTYLSNVTLNPSGGGTVELAADLPSGQTLLLILDDNAPVQEFEFKNKTSFTLEKFERALDAIMSGIQTLALKWKGTFRVHENDVDSFDPQFPPGVAEQAGRVIQVNAGGDGLEYGPTTEEVANANGYALMAKDYRDEAEVFRDEAEAGAAEANTLLFDGNVTITFPDSPVSLDTTYDSKIVFVNAADGNIDIYLQDIASMPVGFKTQFIRSDESPNVVRIYAYGGQTIDLGATYDLPKGVTVILTPVSATDWKKKFIGLVNGGSTLPSGGDEGEYLELDSNGDAQWQSGTFSGFSARFSQAFDNMGVRDVLLSILNFSYLAPLVNLSASGSGTVREKGTAVTATTLTASVTKRSDAISRIQFFKDGVSIDDNNPPSNTGSGDTTYNWTGSFSDNTSFSVQVTDDGTTGGPSTVSSTANFTFVYPYFFGAGAPGLSAAAVAGLTKDVRTSNANLNKSFTTANGDVYYFAYPASYGALTSILDVNNFETIGDWTLRTENITGLDTTAQSYRIYEFNNPVIAGTTSYTFKR